MELLNAAINASIVASKLIMKHYTQDINVEYKNDNSPVTIADKEADNAIRAILKDTKLPILSEEVNQPSYSERKNWEMFWMVDSLDGTKEFIKKNGEFTVNIALIKNNIPIGGVIAIPAKNTIYFGQDNFGAFKAEPNFNNSDSNWVMHNRYTIAPSLNLSGIVKVAVSRSHISDKTIAYINNLKKDNKVEIISIGSALKIGYLAEGVVQIYPRYSPCMEWDIAAGCGIVNQLGIEFRDNYDNNLLLFNKENLKVNGFIAKHDYLK